MANLPNLRVDSDYHMPWIVWSQQLQFTVGSGDWGSYDTNHGLPFTPLIFGYWSTSANFQPCYDLTTDAPGYSGSGQAELAFLASANGSVVRLVLTNNRTSSTTFYARVMAFAPPDYTGDVQPVEYSDPFTFNSDYRYQKIFMEGQTTQSVTHNLGYIPQFRLWQLTTNTGFVSPVATASSATQYYVPPNITTTQLDLGGAAGAANTSYFYHIYGDQFNG